MAVHEFVLQDIDHETVERLRETIAKAEASESEITLLINSNGGDIKEGLKIVELITHSHALIKGQVIGKAVSMAAVILQACHERSMNETAYLRYHYGSWRVSFRMYFEPEMLQRNIESGIKLQERLILPIAKKTGMSIKRIHDLFREDKRLSAQEALHLGLVDDITRTS